MMEFFLRKLGRAFSSNIFLQKNSTADVLHGTKYVSDELPASSADFSPVLFSLTSSEAALQGRSYKKVF